MKNIFNQKAQGLIEALIALAVVGTAMVIITSISLRTIKQARKNEMQDVAIQAAVEAMDFMKQPGKVTCTASPTPSLCPPGASPAYYSLNVTAPEIIKITSASPLSVCDSTNWVTYGVDNITDFKLCQQIKITPVSAEKYTIDVIVAWKSVGDTDEVRTISGYRLGSIGP